MRPLDKLHRAEDHEHPNDSGEDTRQQKVWDQREGGLTALLPHGPWIARSEGFHGEAGGRVISLQYLREAMAYGAYTEEDTKRANNRKGGGIVRTR